tara:strand:- start:59 stop:610 length:552 start_codon:yes stop_codon:yes gene_type:complete
MININNLQIFLWLIDQGLLMVIIILILVSLLFFFIRDFYLKGKVKNTNTVNNNYKQVVDINIKLRAYERITVFLERIEPLAMLNRLELHQSNVERIQLVLIKNITTEYEYNISQQIYVSDDLWKVVELVKNRIINQISEVALSLDADADSQQFVTKMLEVAPKNHLIMEKALSLLKKEVRQVS